MESQETVRQPTPPPPSTSPPPPPLANDDPLSPAHVPLRLQLLPTTSIEDDDDAIPPPNNDPPPPYPSPRTRRTRANRNPASPTTATIGRIRTTATRHHHQGPRHNSQLVSSADSDNSLNDDALSPHQYHHHRHGEEVDETTPFLSPGPAHPRRTRARAYSHTSTISAAPSLAQTVFSLFDTEDPEDQCEREHNGNGNGADAESGAGAGDDGGYHFIPPGGEGELVEGVSISARRRNGITLKRKSKIARYFRPLWKTVYWKPFFHLVILNFPYALVAWVVLFVFTVTGTTLLVALPIGAVLCFFNLLLARVFARGELYLQTKFHSPLAYPLPTPPRPIFTRLRDPTPAELEESELQIGGGGGGGATMKRDSGFYRNTWAMFTDPQTYLHLFYFLIIKPAITILLSLFLLVFCLPCVILVLPAPVALRAVRKLGAWQANVAVEGLWLGGG